jgi:voltage-gated potassium channel
MPELVTSSPVSVSLPRRKIRPLTAFLRRVAMAVLLVVLVTLLVYADRDGYVDDAGGEIRLLDAFYYATVSVTTTGYGDITPVTDNARLVTALLVTPARVAFLVLLVGTTLELLTERWREAATTTRWRSGLRDHYVICGFGTKGRSAARALLGQGVPAPHIVVIERNQDAIGEANRMGLAAVHGDASRVAVLEEARVGIATAVIVAPNRDDTAVLITLTARELNPKTTIVSAAREQENAHLLRQGGADSVIISAEASGRLLGLATTNPQIVEVVEDVLNVGQGLEIAERTVTPEEVGLGQDEIRGQLTVAVIRDGELMRFDDPRCEYLQPGDRLVGVRAANPGPQEA